MIAFHSNKGSGLRRLWESGLLEVVYDISSHFLWNFHFTFQELAIGQVQPIFDVVD